MPTRTGIPGTLGSVTLSSANFTSLPGGWLGHLQITGNVGSLTHSGDTLTGLTVTVTAGTSRRLKITGVGNFTSTVAGDDFALSIKEDGTQITATSTGGGRNTNNYSLTATAISTPSAGSHTYALFGGISAGSGTATLVATNASPAFILVEDLGPA